MVVITPRLVPYLGLNHVEKKEGDFPPKKPGFVGGKKKEKERKKKVLFSNGNGHNNAKKGKEGEGGGNSIVRQTSVARLRIRNH